MLNNEVPENGLLKGKTALIYGAGGSIRPGDLKNTDSGYAAYLVRSRWQELVEAGAVDVDAPDRVHRMWNRAPLAVAVVLIAAAAVSLGPFS